MALRAKLSNPKYVVNGSKSVRDAFGFFNQRLKSFEFATANEMISIQVGGE